LTGERVERRLAAVLAADVAGYSRLMGADEVGTLTALKTLRRELVDPVIADHKGRIVKTTGDGMLVEFASAFDAVTCAMDVQGKMADGSAVQAIAFRISPLTSTIYDLPNRAHWDARSATSSRYLCAEHTTGTTIVRR
jgi:adenylate cyclase